MIINGQQYTKIQLHRLCEEKLNAQNTLEWEKSIYLFIQNWLSNSTTLQVRTSGTTGTPKIITVSKQQMIQSALMTGEFFQLKAGQNALLCLSANYIAGKMMIVRALVLKLNLIIIEPSSMPLSKLEIIHFAAMVPLQLHHLIFESKSPPNQIKTLIVGGGAVNQQLRKAIKNVDTKIFATYGMTETLSHIAIQPLNGSQASPYYKILEGIKITQDKRKCLVIHAFGKELVTNDRVIIHSENTFQLLGRVDNIINTGGIKIIPEEIERKLESLIMRRFFISSIPDNKLENKIILLIEGSRFNNVELKQLHNNIKNKIVSKFERPKQIYFAKQFIETPTGKIQRQATLDVIRAG